MNTNDIARTETSRRVPHARGRRRAVGSAAVIALLVAACSSGGDESGTPSDTDAPTVTADDSATTEPATTEAPDATDAPTVTEAPETTEPPETAATEPLPLATQGQMIAQCQFGLGGPSPETGRIRATQNCTVSSDGILPIDAEQNLFIEFLDDGPTSTFGDPIIGFSDASHVYGGYVTGGGDGRFVSSVLGTGDYAGEVVHIVGHSPGGGGVTFDWYVGDGPQPFGATGDFDETIEIGIECVPADIPADAASDVTAAETCTYTSDDPRLAMDPTTDVIRTIEVDESGLATGSVTYYNAETDTGVVRGGLVDDEGVRRWAGVVDGLGEIDDVVHEVGWAQTDTDGVTTGVMLFSFGLNPS